MKNKILNFSEEVGLFSHQQIRSVRDSHLARKARPPWVPSLKHGEDKGRNVMLWQNIFILTYSQIENAFHIIASCHNQYLLGSWVDDHQAKVIGVKDKNLLIWMGEKEKGNLRNELKQSKHYWNIASCSQNIWLSTTYGFLCYFSRFRFLPLFSPTLSRSSVLLHFSRRRRRGGSHLPTPSHQGPLWPEGSWKASHSQGVPGTLQTLFGCSCGSSPAFLPWTQQFSLLSSRSSV